MRARIAVLASGGGSNLQAILDYFDSLGESRSGDVVLVVSDRADAQALACARQRDIPAVVLSDPSDGEELCAGLTTCDVHLVALAGYLRLLPKRVVALYRHRILNVHPAPLPQFGGRGMYGRKVHQAVLESGVQRTGATVHFVDEEYDHGDVIAHWPVAVRADDTAETLATRVLRAEHLVYPRILDMVAALTRAEPGR